LDARVLRIRKNLIGINDGDDAVQADAVAEIGLDKRKGNSRGIGHAAGFQQDVLRLFGAVDDHFHRLYQIVANIAADAAVCQADGVVFHSDDEFRVDVDGAKVVDQHGHPQPMISVQDAVEQGGFPCPKEAGQDSDRDGLKRVIRYFHTYVLQ
jgi:hypothetical protein